VGWYVRSAAIALTTVVVAGLLSEAPVAGAPRTVTFTPQADATVRADRPTKSYGTATSLTVDNSPVIHTLLRFTVTGVGSDTVNGVALRLYTTNPSPASGKVFRVASQTWTEGVTWNTAPTADATPITTGGSGGAQYMGAVRSVVFRQDGRHVLRAHHDLERGRGDVRFT